MGSVTSVAYFAFIIISQFRAEEISFWDEGLTSIPFEQISINVTELKLTKNYISVVDSFSYYPQLTILWFGANLLSIFPNLCASGSSIQTLGLKNNQLIHIPPERMDCLVSLEKLILAKNKLSSFPDVTGPGQSLASLDIEYNQFEEFPNLSGLSNKLHTVLAGDNRLHTIALSSVKIPKVVPLKVILRGNSNLTATPNLGFWNVKYLDIRWITFDCSRNMGWIKMFKAAGLMLKIDSQPCVSPSNLVGKNWTDIQLQELLRQGNDQHDVLYKIMDQHYGGSPIPVVQLFNLSKLGCAVLCESTAGCVAFGYSPPSTDFTAACFLTGDGPEIDTTNFTNIKWYTA